MKPKVESLGEQFLGAIEVKGRKAEFFADLDGGNPPSVTLRAVEVSEDGETLSEVSETIDGIVEETIEFLSD